MHGGIRMVSSYQNNMKEKIPIEITWMENENGVEEPEIVIDAQDCFDFNTSIAEAIVNFKKRYMNLIQKIQEILPEDKTERKLGQRALRPQAPPCRQV